MRKLKIHLDITIILLYICGLANQRFKLFLINKMNVSRQYRISQANYLVKFTELQATLTNNEICLHINASNKSLSKYSGKGASHE